MKLSAPMVAGHWVLWVALLLSCPTTGTEVKRQQGEAEVTADKLQVDHKKRTAKFEGNVHATLDTLTLRCARMTLTYDKAGEVKILNASGSVTVMREDLRATAKSARLDAKSGRLLLNGSPTVTKGPHRLTGEVIEVDLNTGQLTVQAARGTFRLKKGGK